MNMSPSIIKKMSVGLFGGTFDPIHNGHIVAAKHILEKLSLDHIYFIPAHYSPFKTSLKISPPRHRLAMLNLALQKLKKTSVSKFELNRKKISYTIDTVKYYKRTASNSDFYFILGLDAFLDISKWKDVADLFRYAHFVVMNRPGFKMKSLSEILQNTSILNEFRTVKKGKIYQHSSGHRILFFKSPLVDISSTEIRKKIEQGEPYSLFVPKQVEIYILTQGLYKNG